MNRDLARRVARLEIDRSSDRIRYVVSDRMLSDAEWQAERDGFALGIDELMSPIMTVAQWAAGYCEPGAHRH